MARVVVLFSGGIDSTVLLWQLKSGGHECVALGVNYGQRHAVELNYAAAIAAKASVGFEFASAVLPWAHSALTGTRPLPLRLPGAAPEQVATVVPGRNLLLLSVALAKAIAVDADGIAVGCHQGDAAIYHDCRNQFLNAFEHMTRLSVGRLVGIYRPFIGMTKAEVVDEGRRNGAPLNMTYSCYAGGSEHCGECGACVERLAAMDKGTQQEKP